MVDRDSDWLIAFAEDHGYEYSPEKMTYVYGKETMIERESRLADMGLRDKSKVKGLEGAFGMRDPTRIKGIKRASDAWDELVGHDVRKRAEIKSLKDMEKLDTDSYRKIADKATITVKGKDYNLLGKNADKVIEDILQEKRKLQAERERLKATTSKDDFERAAQGIAKDNPFIAEVLGIGKKGPSFYKQEAAKKSKISPSVERFQKLSQEEILGGRTKTLKGLAKNLGLSPDKTTELLQGKGITVGKTGRFTTPEKELDALSERIARLGREAEDLTTSARKLRRV